MVVRSAFFFYVWLFLLPFSPFISSVVAQESQGEATAGQQSTQDPSAPTNTANTDTPQPEPTGEAQFVLGGGEDQATAQTPQATPRASAGVSFMSTLRAFFMLGIVLALAYFFLRFLRKLSGQEVQQSSVIKVMASQSIKGQASIHIVEIAQTLYLLGVGDTVTLISTITDKETVDQLKLELTQQQEKPQSFSQLLKTKLAIQGADPVVKATLSTEQHADRLRKLMDDKKDSPGSTQT